MPSLPPPALPGMRRPGLLLCALLAAAGLQVGACRRPARAPAESEPRRRAVPSPVENPAGYCRDSCPLKVRCRLGQVAKPLFDAEVDRCRDACLKWIPEHPREAAALAPCYELRQCGTQRGCLAEVGRILEDRAVPAKLKECQEMCITLGTCQGDATDCRLRCRTGAVPIFRALIRCGTKRCPDLKTCVEDVLSGREEKRPAGRPTAVDTTPESP